MIRIIRNKVIDCCQTGKKTLNSLILSEVEGTQNEVSFIAQAQVTVNPVLPKKKIMFNQE